MTFLKFVMILIGICAVIACLIEYTTIACFFFHSHVVLILSYDNLLFNHIIIFLNKQYFFGM
jgi:hypothetical protein